jgi:hypothetical protein
MEDWIGFLAMDFCVTYFCEGVAVTVTLVAALFWFWLSEVRRVLLSWCWRLEKTNIDDIDEASPSYAVGCILRWLALAISVAQSGRDVGQLFHSHYVLREP